MTAPVSQHRRVSLFVALHVGAVAVIYALALIIGGTHVTPPVPAASVGTVVASTSSGMASPQAPEPGPETLAPTALPAWAQRAETTLRWEDR